MNKIPSNMDRARLEVIKAARIMRQADSCLKDSCLALVKAERILGADDPQNAIQAQRVRTEAVRHELSSVAATLEVLLAAE